MPGRYLLAQCCHKLGKFDEAKGALAAGGKGEVRSAVSPCREVRGGRHGCPVPEETWMRRMPVCRFQEELPVTISWESFTA